MKAFARRLGLAVAALGLAVGVGERADAALALTFDESTGGSALQQSQSVGWQFDVLSTLTVTGLAWYDEGQNGLSLAHTVGIWDSSGNLLTSVVVPFGTAAPLDGIFRVQAIAPITLGPGTGYIIGGENFANNTERVALNTVQSVDPRVSYVDATFSNIGSGFTRPAQFSTASNGFYGVNFQVASAAAVPEPATLAGGVLGIALLGGAWLRRRKPRAA